MQNNKIVLVKKLMKELDKINYIETVDHYRRVLNECSEVTDILKELFSDVKDNTVNIDFLQEDNISNLAKEIILFYIEEKNYKIDIEEVEKKSNDLFLTDNHLNDYLREIENIPLYTKEERMIVFPKHKEIREFNKKLRYDMIGANFNTLKAIADKFKRHNLDYHSILRFEVELLHEDIKNKRFFTDKEELKLYLFKKVKEFSDSKKTGKKFDYDFTPYENSITTIDEVPDLYKIHLESYKSEQDIRNDIINHNMRLVVKKAYEYKRKYPTNSLVDLLQDGMEGLINILDNDYDYERASFTTYAYVGLDYKYRRIIENNDSTVRISSGMRSLALKYNAFIAKFMDEFKRYPTNEEICSELEISMDRLYDVIQANNVKQLVSLDEPIKNDEEDSFLGDFVKDSSSNVEEETLQNIVYEQLLDILDGYDDITKAVLMGRNGFVPKDTIVIKKQKGIAILSNHPLYTAEINKYLTDDKLIHEIHDRLLKNRGKVISIRSNLTYVELERNRILKLEELGKLLYCTRERIRQIENRGLRSLRGKKGKELKNLLD